MNPRKTRRTRPSTHGAPARTARGVVGLGAAGLMVVALGACGSNDAAEPAPAGDEVASVTTTAEQPTTSQATTSAAPTASPSSAAAAPADAQAHNDAALAAISTAAGAANGTAYEIDDEDDDQTWEVDVMVGERSVEVEVSGDGRTVQAQTDDDDADDDDRARLGRAQTTLEQAIEAALAEVPGTLDDVELDDEDGVDVWEVTIDGPESDDVEVYVAADDARIIKVDR